MHADFLTMSLSQLTTLPTWNLVLSCMQWKCTVIKVTNSKHNLHVKGNKYSINRQTVMWVRISSVLAEKQSQNKQTASNPEGPVHSAHSLKCNIAKL